MSMLFAIREALGQVFGWDGQEAAADPTRPSLRNRLPADLRDSQSTVHPAMGFTPLYQTDDEWAAELINRTVHGVIHLGWVPDGAGGYRGQMAVLVKPNGLLGTRLHGGHQAVSLSDRLPTHAERSWPKVAVVQRRSIVAAEGCDYADAFEIPMSAADTRSAEDLVRAGLEEVPRWLGVVVLMVHRHVLRLELVQRLLVESSSGLGDRRPPSATASHCGQPALSWAPFSWRDVCRRRSPCSRRSSATGDRCWRALSGRPSRPSIAWSHDIYCGRAAKASGER